MLRYNQLDSGRASGGIVMGKKLVMVVALGSALMAMLGAAPAFGSTTATTKSVSMTFAEPIIPGIVMGCPIPPNQGLCGSGQVIPFGHATETVVFGAACGGTCDLRTINLPGGSIITNEIFSNGTCPAGQCVRPGNGQPASGMISDVIVDGTGVFAGATGDLSGSVHAAGTAGITHLKGTITLPS
jgi:hypothetical protein